LILGPKAVDQIGLALHELGTNAVKHGALSVGTGTVRITWALEPDEFDQERLRLTWKESGGPPVIQPQCAGFGSLLITRIVPAALRGTAMLDFEPDGLKWVLLAPWAHTVISSASITRGGRAHAAPRERNVADRIVADA
jgi:two-component sensor histidine kinase